MFNNRENECVTTVDDRKFFISRSVAVIATVLYQSGRPDEEALVLVNQRSNECPDHAGKWNMPCGYLDWNENGGNAARREVYEECGLDILELSKKVPRILDQGMLQNRPWRVITEPQDDAHQNVLFYYSFRFVDDEPPKLGGGSHAHEVIDVQWMPISEALKTPMAFDHHLRLSNYLDYALRDGELAHLVRALR